MIKVLSGNSVRYLDSDTAEATMDMVLVEGGISFQVQAAEEDEFRSVILEPAQLRHLVERLSEWGIVKKGLTEVMYTDNNHHNQTVHADPASAAVIRLLDRMADSLQTISEQGRGL